MQVIKLFRDQVHCGFLRVFHWDKAIKAALLCALGLLKVPRVTPDKVLEAQTNEKYQKIDWAALFYLRKACPYDKIVK